MMEKTQEKGLSSAEARRRLLQDGENLISKRRRGSALAVFVGQFRDVMVMILLAATAVSALLGEIYEAIAVAVIVLLNAMLGFFQQWRCEKTLEMLAKLSAPTAKVIRDGKAVEVDASQVVTGDILIISAGDCVAADAVILKQSALKCDESMLTGESVPVQKNACQSELAAKDGEKVFMGTHAVAGSCEACVFATGMNTKMGEIAGLLENIEEQQTPLQQRLDQIGRTIGIGCLAICAAVAAVGIWRGEKPLDMLITGISLAVAAVPEGLPAIVTVSLALAVRRILHRNALIKRLHAVETLGCTTVICSDKTGTLTQNRMTVLKTATLFNEYCDGKRISPKDPAAQLLYSCAAFCSDAKAVRKPSGPLMFGKNGGKEYIGDPTEAAMLKAAVDAGVSADSFYRKGELPFDSERKRMTVWGICRDGAERVFMKGAPEVVLGCCESIMTESGVLPLDPQHKEKVIKKNEQFAGEALRVIGFAYKEKGEDPEKKLIFLGIMGLFDPPRPEAFEAVKKCRRAGIRTVMITGDHAVTALAVAKKLGIVGERGNVVTGRQLDAMNDRQLCDICQKADVFARVTPVHKLRIVRALKQNGEITAMTGDGVNDAPAVKEADIGVSMGESGTDVTREASDMILLDDNFATIVAAVEEGRVIYQNIRRFLRYLLSCNAGEVFTMFGGMLMGMPVILTPIQLLLVNLVTDGLPAIALGLEPADKNVMRRPPRDPEESVFAGGLLGKIVFRGLLIGLTTLGIFSAFYADGCSIAEARTAALLTLTVTQLFHVFECRNENGGLFSINPFSNPFLLAAAAVSAAAVMAAVYSTAASRIFMTVPLTAIQTAKALAASAAVPIISSVISAMEKK